MHDSIKTMPSIPSLELDRVFGGAAKSDETDPQFKFNFDVEVKADVNKALEQVGEATRRLVGCPMGSHGKRETGDCILTGKRSTSDDRTQTPPK